MTRQRDERFRIYPNSRTNILPTTGEECICLTQNIKGLSVCLKSHRKTAYACKTCEIRLVVEPFVYLNWSNCLLFWPLDRRQKWTNTQAGLSQGCQETRLPLRCLCLFNTSSTATNGVLDRIYTKLDTTNDHRSLYLLYSLCLTVHRPDKKRRRIWSAKWWLTSWCAGLSEPGKG